MKTKYKFPTKELARKRRLEWYEKVEEKRKNIYLEASFKRYSYYHRGADFGGYTFEVPHKIKKGQESIRVPIYDEQGIIIANYVMLLCELGLDKQKTRPKSIINIL